MRKRTSVDIGGTFTDIVVVTEDGTVRTGKVLTTPHEEARGVRTVVANTVSDLASVDVFVHGTTLVINTLLERSGPKTALVTTQGFRDVTELGRSSRPEIFNWFFRREKPLVPRHLRFELHERTLADGTAQDVPDEGQVKRLAEVLAQSDVGAVAVAFLNSYVNPANEDAVAAQLRECLPDIFVTTSSSLSRAWREYERFSTATANAFVGPRIDAYLTQLASTLAGEGMSTPVRLMDSNGGALSVATARRYPIRLIESGPVGGVVGAAALVGALDRSSLVTFDMGGTTAKSSFVVDGKLPASDLYWVTGYDRGYPLQIPSVSITEIGSGGGSVAWVDDSGRLRVGPRSAGAEPGPACYGRGGVEPTVTDANVFLGRMPTGCFLASFPLDAAAAATAIETLASKMELTPTRLAEGIVAIAELAMANLMRQQTLERGRDPRDFSMIAFGGAGPLHACNVAREAGIREVIVPPAPGNFSALGMLHAVPKFDRREIFQEKLDTIDLGRLENVLRRVGSDLRTELTDSLPVEGAEALSFRFGVALRFVGQDNTLVVYRPEAEGLHPVPQMAQELRAAYLAEYRLRYGHAEESEAIEVIEVIVEASIPDAGVGGQAFRFDYEEKPGIVPQVAQVVFGDDESPVDCPIEYRGNLIPGTVRGGPLLVPEEGSLTLVPPDFDCELSAAGYLVMRLREKVEG